ncbi:MAG: YozE family protein [Oscillospiraceae bacterium]|nr:YozE family protein [Oscillospiraceae bacterium]
MPAVKGYTAKRFKQREDVIILAVNFKNWLAAFEKAAGPTGDLARRFRGDTGFPEDATYYQLAYYVGQKADFQWEITESFIDAWDKYVAEVAGYSGQRF